MEPLAAKGSSHCQAKSISGKMVTVKIKYSDFTQATRSRTGTLPVTGVAEITEAASALLSTVYPFKRPIRLLGVTLSSLTNDQSEDDGEQPQLYLAL